MPCSCDARDVVVPQVKSTAWPARGLSGFHAGARNVPFVSALILTSVWVLQHVFFRVLVPCAPVLLCSSDPPVVRAAAQTCVPRLDTSPAGQARPGVPPWPSCSSCCSAAGPAGGSAPRDPTLQHGTGVTHGIFIPIRRYTRVLCVHERLCAKEERQIMAESVGTRPVSGLRRTSPAPTCIFNGH